MTVGSRDMRIEHEKRQAQLFAPRRELVVNPMGFLEWEDGDRINMHDLLTAGSNNCRLTRMDSDDLEPVGIYNGNFLLVDQAMQPQHKSHIFLRLDDTLMVRRLMKRSEGWFLVSEDTRQPDIQIKKSMDIEKLGVVRWALSRLY